MADFRQVFAFLVGFAVVMFLIVTTSNMLNSIIEGSETTGEKVFRTQKYMAGAINLYTRGGKGFGVYKVGENKEELCDLDPSILSNHKLGYDIRYGGKGAAGGSGGTVEWNYQVKCHDPSKYMSVVMLNQFDNEYSSDLGAETLEVGKR